MTLNRGHSLEGFRGSIESVEFGDVDFRRYGEAMAVRFILTDYVDGALELAVYDKLEDGTFAGRVPDCPGAIAFGASLRACEDELRSTVEDWIVVGLKLGHHLPVIAGIDLNVEPMREPVDAL
jgi:predicted RNase H-like HicB family nuclease